VFEPRPLVDASGNLCGAIQYAGERERSLEGAKHAAPALAQNVHLPARRQLNDLPDDLWTRISIEFYKDGADAVFKALVE